jgi:hypothetical protein
MSHDNKSSAASSARTSASAPTTPAGESEFLTKQAADAKAAIGSVVNDLKQDLAKSIDPRGWVQTAPWTTLAAGAVAGFVAAAVAVPSKEDQALKRLRKLEEALNPHPRRDTVDTAVNGDHARKVETGQSSFLAGLAGQVLRAVQPVLMSALTAGITAKTVKDDEPPQGTDPGTVAYGDKTSASPSGETPAI